MSGLDFAALAVNEMMALQELPAGSEQVIFGPVKVPPATVAGAADCLADAASVRSAAGVGVGAGAGMGVGAGVGGEPSG